MCAGVATSFLEPLRVFSCLTVLIRAVQSEALPAAKPQQYESILELFYLLAAAPDSGPPMMHLLRQAAGLSAQLDVVACSPLPLQVRLSSLAGGLRKPFSRR